MFEDQVATTRVVIQQPALPRYRVPVFRELARRRGIGLRVVYASEPGLPNATPDGFVGVPSHVRRLPGGLYWDGGQLLSVLDGQPDVVVFSWNVRFLSLVPALLLARQRGIGTVLWGHGYSKRARKAALILRRRVAGMASAVLFYNKREAASYAAAVGDPERVFVAPNALDTEPGEMAREDWLSRPGALDAFRRQNGLGDKPVLFVSRLFEANRVDVLLDAASRLRRSTPGLSVVVIGDGPARRDLEDQACRLGLEGLVRFIGAVYDEGQLAPWFLVARAFCYPGNIGLSLLHAFMYGLPVVTGDNLRTHNPEIEALRPGENGLLFRDGDAGDLAAKLSLILGDPDLAVRMRANCLRTSREEYTLARMVDGLEAAIGYASAHRPERSGGA